MEALQFYSTTQSHWCSGSTICFLSRGSAVRVPGMHKLTMEPGFSYQHCLATLVTPMWLITGLALGSVPTMGSFTRHHPDDVKSQLWSHIAFPGSIPLLAGPPPPHNTVTGQSPSQVAVGGGGDLWRPCNFSPPHSLTGPVGQPFASHLGGQRFMSCGCTNSQLNWVSSVSVVSLQYSE